MAPVVGSTTERLSKLDINGDSISSVLNLHMNLSTLSTDETKLAVMLVEAGQSPLFQGWAEPDVEDEEKRGFFEQVALGERLGYNGIKLALPSETTTGTRVNCGSHIFAPLSTILPTIASLHYKTTTQLAPKLIIFFFFFFFFFFFVVIAEVAPPLISAKLLF